MNVHSLPLRGNLRGSIHLGSQGTGEQSPMLKLVETIRIRLVCRACDTVHSPRQIISNTSTYGNRFTYKQSDYTISIFYAKVRCISAVNGITRTTFLFPALFDKRTKIKVLKIPFFSIGTRQCVLKEFLFVFQCLELLLVVNVDRNTGKTYHKIRQLTCLCDQFNRLEKVS